MKVIKLPVKQIEKFYEILDKNPQWAECCAYYKRPDGGYGRSKREVFVRRCWKLFSDKYLNGKYKAIGIMQESDSDYREDVRMYSSGGWDKIEKSQDYLVLFEKDKFNLCISNTLDGNYRLMLACFDLLSFQFMHIDVSEYVLHQTTFYNLNSEYSTITKLIGIRNFMMKNLNTQHHQELMLQNAKIMFYRKKFAETKRWTEKKTRDADNEWKKISKDKETVEKLSKQFRDIQFSENLQLRTSGLR